MVKIALDGPSGSGKSTVAKAISARLGIVYVDTGALYRSVGYYVRTKDLDPKNAEQVESVLPEIELDVRYENGVQCVFISYIKLDFGQNRLHLLCVFRV